MQTLNFTQQREFPADKEGELILERIVEKLKKDSHNRHKAKFKSRMNNGKFYGLVELRRGAGSPDNVYSGDTVRIRIYGSEREFPVYYTKNTNI